MLTGKSGKLWEEIRLWQRESSGKEPVVTFADHQVWYLRPMGMELKIEQFRLFLDAMATFDETVHVCIIDEAQTMMDPVANSLLKTLEEPEGNVHFILITHDLHALLPTIISRGERFAFLPLSESITSRREWMRRCSSSFRKEIRGSRWRSVMKRERQSRSQRWISGIS
ncbi:DNA polymerase III [Bacteroides xylanisolvens]|nr:DNA polymerase III [Bacteroides xylanisolvens]